MFPLIYLRLYLLPLLLALIWPCATSAETTYAEAYQAYDEKRYAEAYRLLVPLAEEGEGPAQLALSLLYEKGLGVEQDLVKAITWYEKAAIQGDPVIQYELGLKFFNGDGIDQNYDKAATWWLKSAAKGHVSAQYNLALMYVKGVGFNKNLRMAIEWLEKAANKDHAPAHYSLGVIYATGNGVEQDYQRAFLAFSKSAPHGIVEAQYNLGVCYEKGRGTQVDQEKARFWFAKAADQGFVKAQKKLESYSPDAVPSENIPPVSSTISSAQPEADALDPNALDELWLNQQDPEAYALQLVALSSLAAVKRFFDTYQLAHPKGYYTVHKGNKVFYRIVQGAYESRQSAESAREDIKADFNELAPVIVSYATIQSAVD